MTTVPRAITCLAASALLACACAADARGQATTNTQTFSTSRSEAVVTTIATARQDVFRTRLVGRASPGGPAVYDQAFDLPFADPQVQAAAGQARAAVLAAAAGRPVVGPALAARDTSLVGSILNTAETGRTAEEFLGLTETVGPGTVRTGDLGLATGFVQTPLGVLPVGTTGGTPFAVPAGSVNLNTNLHTHLTIHRLATTTETYRTTEVYDVTAVPEPSAAAGAGATAVGLLRRRRRRA